MRGFFLALLMLPTVVFAVEPGEQLDDPALETRHQREGAGL